MSAKSTSDQIEDYIRDLVEQTGLAVLKRCQLAESFQVVPSQINYVIKTRFTEKQGYLVESKRGGGGYIRIARLTFSDQHQLLRHLLTEIDNQVSEQTWLQILAYLCDEGILTQREVQLISGLAYDNLLGQNSPNLRAKMLRHLLQRLDRKG